MSPSELNKICTEQFQFTDDRQVMSGIRWVVVQETEIRVSAVVIWDSALATYEGQATATAADAVEATKAACRRAFLAAYRSTGKPRVSAV